MHGSRRAIGRSAATVLLSTMLLTLGIGVAPAAAQVVDDSQPDVCSGNIFVPPVPIPGFDVSDEQAVLVRAILVKGCDVDDVVLVVTYADGLTWLQGGNDIRLSDAPACTPEDTSSFCAGEPLTVE